ncbi:MAG: helix-turn-helix domain-containing protein [Bdellovibrionales bacterium]
MSSINKSKPEEQSSGSFFENLKWITTREAAKYLRVSVGQLRNMVWRGQVVSYRVNNRLRFLRTDLDKIVKPSNHWRSS